MQMHIEVGPVDGVYRCPKCGSGADLTFYPTAVIKVSVIDGRLVLTEVLDLNLIEQDFCAGSAECRACGYGVEGVPSAGEFIACEACLGLGWLETTEEGIERCDACALFDNDDVAIAFAGRTFTSSESDVPVTLSALVQTNMDKTGDGEWDASMAMRLQNLLCTLAVGESETLNMGAWGSTTYTRVG